MICCGCCTPTTNHKTTTPTTNHKTTTPTTNHKTTTSTTNHKTTTPEGEKLNIIERGNCCGMW
jgi:hypothetical protein